MLRKVHPSDERQASLEAFRARHGRALEDWAAWCALAEVHGPDYRTWPARLRDPRSVAVATELRGGDLAAQAEFHTWVQWLVAAQVSAAQQAARSAGMADRHHRTTWRSARTPAARTRGRGRSSSLAGSPSARRPTRSTSAVRTGGCRRCTRARSPPPPTGRCATCRRGPLPRRRAAHRPRHGAVPAVVDPGGRAADRGCVRLLRRGGNARHARRRGGRVRLRRGRRGPRHRRAVAAGRARRAGRARHADAVVRARLVQRAARAAVVAAQQHGHRLHARPAARRRVPFRLPGDRPPRPRPAHPHGRRGTSRGRPPGRRLDRRPGRAGPA